MGNLVSRGDVLAEEAVVVNAVDVVGDVKSDAEGEESQATIAISSSTFGFGTASN